MKAFRFGKEELLRSVGFGIATIAMPQTLFYPFFSTSLASIEYIYVLLKTRLKRQSDTKNRIQKSQAAFEISGKRYEKKKCKS